MPFFDKLFSGMANSTCPDQTAPSGSESALCRYQFVRNFGVQVIGLPPHPPHPIPHSRMLPSIFWGGLLLWFCHPSVHPYPHTFEKSYGNIVTHLSSVGMNVYFHLSVSTKLATSLPHMVRVCISNIIFASIHQQSITPPPKPLGGIQPNLLHHFPLMVRVSESNIIFLCICHPSICLSGYLS